MAIEQTYIMLKPDCLKRGLMGEVITRIEKKGYHLVDAKMFEMSEELLKEHYAHIIGEPYWPITKEYMTSGPVFGMIVEGEGAIQGMRSLMGPTIGAQPGTIRGDYAFDIPHNIIHGSDSEETAKIEIKRFFNK